MPTPKQSLRIPCRALLAPCVLSVCSPTLCRVGCRHCVLMRSRTKTSVINGVPTPLFLTCIFIFTCKNCHGDCVHCDGGTGSTAVHCGAVSPLHTQLLSDAAPTGAGSAAVDKSTFDTRTPAHGRLVKHCSWPGVFAVPRTFINVTFVAVTPLPIGCVPGVS
eukprot:m.305556 g.305556  ORF g.305556 m.305556 type:complete len:162 (-) comp27344_c0_seq3:1358-1843(-)